MHNSNVNDSASGSIIELIADDQSWENKHAELFFTF